MGRGGSRLQRQILGLALQEKFVTCEEILNELWGWQPLKQRCKKADFDRAKYASAHATLSRSLTRLWVRGLITYWQHKLTHFRTGITLTDEGKVLAQAISEDKAEDTING
jgi:hypothetical protein